MFNKPINLSVEVYPNSKTVSRVCRKEILLDGGSWFRV